MASLPRIYRAVQSYCLENPSGPIDAYTISAVIGESREAVERVCEKLVQAGILVKLEDTPCPLFQVTEHGRQGETRSYR
jgi:predicted transcriptional regulator